MQKEGNNTGKAYNKGLKNDRVNNKKPNIICFIMDQLRYDHLGFMGNSVVKTPNLDKLAESGVVFERAYVANPLCQPARATLFTGLTPRCHGVRTNGIPLSRDIPTMPEVLRQAGYHTHSVGKLHLGNYGLPNGADIDDINPEDYPECKELWDKGLIKEIPTPYYGLESVDYAGGHVSWVFGEYIEWLKDKNPEVYERISFDHPDNKKRIGPECFDWEIPEELHYNRWIADRSIDFLEKQGSVSNSGNSKHNSNLAGTVNKNKKGNEEENPFFLWVSFPDPHHPFAAPEPWGSMYAPEGISVDNIKRREGELADLPPFFKQAFQDKMTVLSGLHGKSKVSDEELRDMIALTYGMISFVDQEIGRIINKVNEQGLRENTVIVFLADHGDMMGDHWMIRKGHFQFDGLLRMPFIWNWPGHFQQGFRSGGLVSQIDFAPTILDICGLDIPEGIVPEERETDQEVYAWPGKSLLPQLKGEQNSVNDYVIVENDEDYLGLRVRTFITDHYKLTIYPGREYGELFDLQEDPDELYNLWDNPDFSDIKSKLYQEFLEAYILQDSPLPRRLCHA